MLNRDALADELNTLLATETRSLVRHVQSEAKPHLTPRTFKVWKTLVDMGHTSLEHAHRLSDLIDKLELPPRSIPFDTSVADFHYMTIERLLGPIVEEKNRQVAAYERAIKHAQGSAAAVTDLNMLLEENRKQLAALKAVAESLAVSLA